MHFILIYSVTEYDCKKITIFSWSTIFLGALADFGSEKEQKQKPEATGSDPATKVYLFKS